MSRVLEDTGRVPTVDEPTPAVETMRRNEFGAVWCDLPGHGRWEPTHLTKRRERCHQPAIAGTDQCKMHPGRPVAEVKAKGQAALKAQRFRDVAPGEYIDPGDVLRWAVTVAFIDVVGYRQELRDKTAGGQGLEPTEVDRLMRMQADVARISKTALDAGIDERALRLAERTAEQLVAVLRGVVTDLGHDAADPEVAAVCRRHLALVAGEVAA